MLRGFRPRPALPPQHHPPIAEDLGDVAAGDGLGAFEVGEGARDPEHPVVAAGGQLELAERLGEQRPSRPVGGGGRARSAALTAGTSTWRSMRSKSGPEILPW
jgi:hypothetical protein